MSFVSLPPPPKKIITTLVGLVIHIAQCFHTVDGKTEVGHIFFTVIYHTVMQQVAVHSLMGLQNVMLSIYRVRWVHLYVHV